MGRPANKNKSGSPNRTAAVLHALWQFCRRKPLGAIGGFIVLVLLIMALFAPWIAPYKYDETIPGARMKAPGAQFWMGTDNLGRDVYSRVVYGARVSVTVGFGAVLLANVLAARHRHHQRLLRRRLRHLRAARGRRLAVLPVPGGHPLDDGRPRARDCSTWSWPWACWARPPPRG